MKPPDDSLAHHRRRFLTSTASGLGAAAVLSLLEPTAYWPPTRPALIRVRSHPARPTSRPGSRTAFSSSWPAARARSSCSIPSRSWPN